jgi:lysophospholipase L1-like esterase
MKHPILARIALALAGVLVSLLFIEAFLRLVMPQIFEVHPPGMYVSDPSTGYALTPGFEGYVRRAEFRTYFTIGQSGMRGADPQPRKPPTVRILVLGDSQAWGFGVTDEETFATRLETRLTDAYPEFDIQVLNAGVPGYGTADQLAFLQSRGARLEPDLVIVQFLSVNDLQENHTPARAWAMIKDGMLAHRDPPYEKEAVKSLALWEQTRRWLKSNSHLARLAFDSVGYLGIQVGVLNRVDALWGEDFSEEDAQLGTDLLVQIAQTSADLGAKSLFLYTTGQAQVIQDTYERPRSATVVENAAHQAIVPWIDAAKQLHQRPDRHQMYYAKDGHWTPAGHQAIAEILANEIVELGLIDPEARQQVQEE